MKGAEALGIEWPLTANVIDEILQERLRSGNAKEKAPKNEVLRKMPNLEYVHKELMKNGVSLRLLWNEYCADCNSRKELPMMYSRFWHYYQKFAENKRATMHIPSRAD